MAAKKSQTKGNELTFTHLIVTGLAMLVIGYLFGRFSVVMPETRQSSGLPPAAQTAAAFDFETLERATRESPNSADAWTVLGNAYFDTGRFADAVGAYTRSLSIDDRNPNVWTDRGVMYRRLGNPERAIADFEEAMAIDPRHVMSRFNKGIVLYYDLEDSDAALRSFRDVLSIDPDFITPAGAALRDFVRSLE